MNYILVIIITIIAVAIGYFAQKPNVPDDAPQEQTANIESKRFSAPTSNTLDLSGQGLTKAPAYVFNRTDITKLDLSHNQLDGALQAEIRHLQNLTVLNLSDNKFTGVPAEIGQLKNLETLDLSRNLLTGLPYELGNLQKLKLLNMSGNAYSEADLARIRQKLPASTIIKTN